MAQAMGKRKGARACSLALAARDLHKISAILYFAYPIEDEDVSLALPHPACAPPETAGGRVWGLWEMVHNFSFTGVGHILAELDILIHVAGHNGNFLATLTDEQKIAASRSEKLNDANEQSRKQIEYIVDATTRNLAWINCDHIDSANKRLERLGKRDELPWLDLKAAGCALRDAINVELKSYYFYQYPKDGGKRLANWKSDWPKTVVAFPAAQRDIFDATDCYALQKHTASVFHSMRVVERGLRAIAGERRLRLPRNKPVEWATWQEVIKALDAEIHVIGQKKAGQAKDAALEFYSGARADLNGFKDEFRNSVMHVRAEYDEFQALRALTKVQVFMERISERLNQSQNRIRWGRM